MLPGDTENRRGFLNKLMYGAWGIIAATLGAPAATYLLTPAKMQGQSDWIETAALAELETGVPEEVIFRRNRVDGWKVTSAKATAWLVKKSDHEVVAFAPQCTHLGCAYHWDEQKQNFLCPCHSSAFSIDGQVLSGPAPRPLDRYEVKIEGRKIWVGAVRKSEEA